MSASLGFLQREFISFKYIRIARKSMKLIFKNLSKRIHFFQIHKDSKKINAIDFQKCFSIKETNQMKNILNSHVSELNLNSIFHQDTCTIRDRNFDIFLLNINNGQVIVISSRCGHTLALKRSSNKNISL